MGPSLLDRPILSYKYGIDDVNYGKLNQDKKKELHPPMTGGFP